MDTFAIIIHMHCRGGTMSVLSVEVPWVYHETVPLQSAYDLTRVKKTSVADPDPHWFGSPGSGSVSKSKEIYQNLQINLIFNLWQGFCAYLLWNMFYLLPTVRIVYFPLKNSPFFTLSIGRKMPIFRTPTVISDKPGGFTAFLATGKVIDKYKILKLLN